MFILTKSILLFFLLNLHFKKKQKLKTASKYLEKKNNKTRIIFNFILSYRNDNATRCAVNERGYTSREKLYSPAQVYIHRKM